MNLLEFGARQNVTSLIVMLSTSYRLNGTCGGNAMADAMRKAESLNEVIRDYDSARRADGWYRGEKPGTFEKEADGKTIVSNASSALELCIEQYIAAPAILPVAFHAITRECADRLDVKGTTILVQSPSFELAARSYGYHVSPHGPGMLNSQGQEVLDADGESIDPSEEGNDHWETLCQMEKIDPHARRLPARIERNLCDMIVWACPVGFVFDDGTRP